MISPWHFGKPENDQFISALFGNCLKINPAATLKGENHEDHKARIYQHPCQLFVPGAMFFGTRNDRSTSFRLLDLYVEAGGSFIDTANIYARWVNGFKGYESETLLGQWMKARKNRSNLFIADQSWL